jgi:hypothetical protein
MKEVELAEKVVAWLEVQHWDVYQEVQLDTFDRTADIVALSGNLLWVIECKTSLSLALLEQAIRWRGYANFISIATPNPKRGSRGSDAAKLFLNHFGIGKITVRNRNYDAVSQDHNCKPKLIRQRSNKLFNAITEHHKTWAKAGNCEGIRWTPFQQTCYELEKIVKQDPGMCFKSAMNLLSHHYNKDSTARACMLRYLHKGIVAGVECRKEGNFLNLYPAKK